MQEISLLLLLILLSHDFIYNIQVKYMTEEAANHFSTDTHETHAAGIIGHFTQVIWAHTHEIGCGFISSIREKGSDKVEMVS